MVEKFLGKCAKKGHFNDQMGFRKKSILPPPQNVPEDEGINLEIEDAGF